MTTTKVTALKAGDRFVCPGNGRTDKVVVVHKSVAGHRFVRTDHHDHNFRVDRTVTLVA